MARDPSERYQDVEGLAGALREAQRQRRVPAAVGLGTMSATVASNAPRRITPRPSVVTLAARQSLMDAPTVPDLPAVRPGTRGAPSPPFPGGSGRNYPPNRFIVLGIAAVLLVAAICGVGATRLLGSGGDTGGGPGGTYSSGLTPTSNGTSYVGGGGFPTQSNSTNTPGVIGSSTPTPFGSPTASPSPTATSTPSSTPPLTFYPTTIVLSGTNCSGLQYIANHGQRTVGWQWLPPSIPGYSYRLNGSTPLNGWPQDLNPRIQPGGTDRLRVIAGSHCPARPVSVTVQDTLGDSYSITLVAGNITP
jgi:hypothetical protein